MEMTFDDAGLDRTASAFAALGSEQRLSVLRALVRAGEEGLPMGTLGERTGVTGATLSHHVRTLAQAGLVAQRRDGRRILVTVEIGAVEALSDWLVAECCADRRGHDHG